MVGLARSDEARRYLEGAGARAVAGDLGDEDSLALGMKGCDVVYHVAGLNGMCLRNPSELKLVNVEGSRAVLRAAARAGARRLVYTSSATTIGERRGTVGHEASAHRGFFLSAYERSKFDAERLLFEEAGAQGIELVSVNPSSVQGPGRSGGTARILRAYLNGRLRLFLDTEVSIVDIDDCARGHLLAEERGVAGERYILSGATMTTATAIDTIGRVTGLQERPRAVPPGLAVIGAAVVEVGARLARRDAPVCREMVRTLVHGHAYDGSRAVRELGLAYTPLDATLRRTAEWLVEQGLVTRPLPRLEPQDPTC